MTEAVVGTVGKAKAKRSWTLSAQRIADELNASLLLGLNNSDSDALHEHITEFMSADFSSSDDSTSEDSGEDSSDEYSAMPIEIGEVGEGNETAVEGAEEDPLSLGLGQTDNPVVQVDVAGQIVSEVGTEDYVSSDNDEERQKVNNFSLCRCKAGNCLRQFPTADVIDLRSRMVDGSMTKSERKMLILGKMSTTINRGEYTAKTKRSTQSKRKRSRTTYQVEGKQICRMTFLFMHNISNNQLVALTEHYKSHGFSAPRNWSGGRSQNARAFTDGDIRRIVNYITSYAENHGMVIPGRVAGVKSDDPRVRLLPSSENRSRIWRGYKQQMETVNTRRLAAGQSAFCVAHRSTFTKMWTKYCPFIVTMHPRSDLCWVCQQNNNSVFHSANMTVGQKAERVEKQLEHLRIVNLERDFYREVVKESKSLIADETLGENFPCSREHAMHYSFDFAQQVHIPSNPEQPGPIYFLCPRKVGLFGIACEAVPAQVNYIIDEGMNISKGSNAVISYIHDFFANYGLGECTANLHCDNCSGENKNKFMMWYLSWRTMHGLHKDITLNFLIAGHTKFAPDWGFGLIKKRFRRCVCSSLDQLADIIVESSTSGLNIPRSVGTEDGQTLVPVFDWQAFLSPYYKSLHHMRFSSDHPGLVFTKQYADSPETSFQLLADMATPPPRELPLPLSPPGLSEQRAQYLYSTIREFCTAETRDITCPQPN